MDNRGIHSASPAEMMTRSGHNDPNEKNRTSRTLINSFEKVIDTKVEQDQAMSAVTSSNPSDQAIAKGGLAMKAARRLLSPLQVQVAQKSSRPHSRAPQSKR
jgi:hypothetical protein